jgi:hypothetical protein
VVDLGFCKNEAIFGGAIGFSFFLMHFRDVEEVVQFLDFLRTGIETSLDAARTSAYATSRGGFEETVAPAGPDGVVDLGFRKNEAIFRGAVGFSFFLMHFHDVEDLLQLLSFLGAAGFLELAEQGGGFFELAGEAMAVEAEVGQGFGLVQKPFDEVIGAVGDAEEIAFERDDAVLAPGKVGQGLN